MAQEDLNQKMLNIVIAEDNNSDVFIISRGLTEFNQRSRITAVNDGEALIEVLGLGASKQPIKIPDLIIIDLYMPKLYGLQALQLIKREAKFADVPCVMISHNATDTDKFEAARLGAAGFLNKPESLSDFRRNIASIEAILMREILPELPSSNMPAGHSKALRSGELHKDL